MNISQSLIARSAFSALLAVSLVACGTTVSGTALPDPGALASAALGGVPTDIAGLPTDIPTDPGQVATDEAGTPDEPPSTEAPGIPDVTQIPDEPTDIGDLPTDLGGLPGFGELPEGWPADVVLPDGAVVSFGYGDETGKTVLFSVPGASVPDLGAYFESSLPAAGYAAGQTGEFSGIYSGSFAKDGVSVTIGIIDLDGEITGTVTITDS